MILGAGHGLSDSTVTCSGDRSGIHDIAERRVDLRDVEIGHFEGFEAVIPLGALANDPLGDLNPAITYDVNQARVGE
jgi:hypothetical protein